MRRLCLLAPLAVLALPLGCTDSRGQSGAGTGGVTSTGGTTGTGGVTGTGGAGAGGLGSGGVTATGGVGVASGGGGVPVTGGGGGGSGTGGAVGVDGGGTTSCKRGIAANTAPGPAFFPAVAWWYNWAAQGSSSSGIEFVPMIWGSGSITKVAIPSASRFLLTFNEPNFMAQSNLTAARAASYWPTIQTIAAGIPIVGPGMNFCGPASQCNGTDPYQYLTDFFTACAGCQVDYVAVHWYNCDLPSLRDYLEPGGNLPGFEQFGKPVWLTEFSCDANASAADQEGYMRAAIPYLEGNPNVFRYSWFSADPIPNAKLIGSDGTPTPLGEVYIGLAQNCR